ncbi:MAG TPA: tyrosine--tRNA ligase [Candidatus Saccharimonadales bacterium]|nr:tyrosine--tRNA ligase [Candidatus Saccharimonadales bacterium]
MTLSEELTWRGFVNQTTYKDMRALDGAPISFYFGVDPSSDSMTIGNLAAAMMVRHFMARGHKAFLLVGGATGMIGDPDGKKQERDLLSLDDIARNKAAISKQYQTVFAGQEFTVVDNYDWFKDMGYLQFLRDIGKHVPMRQMLGRDFVQSRLGEDGAGISYAEFSYSLIQGYDFLHLYREHDVTLQVCGADQWGNSITGVDLIRRIAGVEAHVYSVPLVVNKATGVKFGKSEAGAVWLDPAKTSPTQFYQFWINCDDGGIEEYLKVYTMLAKTEVDELVARHRENPRERVAQKRLAEEVTKLIHGDEQLVIAQKITEVLTGNRPLAELDDAALAAMRKEVPAIQAGTGAELADVLERTGLASSKTEARRLIKEKAIAINGQKTQKETLEDSDFTNGCLLIRKGKAFKDSALVERG